MKTQIQLLNGVYNPMDALDLASQLVDLKIRFLENKIKESVSEEDLKMHERQIISLQQQLLEMRLSVLRQNQPVMLNSELNLHVN